VQHIFKNNALLNELKDHISEITDYLDDQTMLHQIAESYAKKSEVNVAHSIYAKLMKKFPGDDKAQRKFLFYQAFKDPKAVNLAD
jgi:6-pyruvoyl-tetrahydropterin synthase